jgi:anti-sigma factor ChrR (cupin superfamily)
MTSIGDGWTDRLSDYLDGGLSPTERAALEAHLGECAPCRTTLAELQAVQDYAAALADREPERDLWPGIAARIEAARAAELRPDGRVTQSSRVWRRRFALSVPQLAAAALVVALIGGGSTLLLSRGPVSSAPPRVATPDSGALGPARFTASGRDVSDMDINRAAADLEAVLKQERSRLDPATAQVLDRNLATIDSALVQIRGALRTQPTDGYLNRSLTSTMLRKLDVLRAAVRLAGAAT